MVLAVLTSLPPQADWRLLAILCMERHTAAEPTVMVSSFRSTQMALVLQCSMILIVITTEHILWEIWFYLAARFMERLLPLAQPMEMAQFIQSIQMERISLCFTVLIMIRIQGRR